MIARATIARVSHAWVLAGCLIAGCALAGCARTSGAALEVPVLSAGARDGEIVSGAWTVRFTRAAVAFGPFWACSTAAASPEFCPEAVLELREAVPIDALAPEMEMLAIAEGRADVANTAMWDLGLSWLPTAAAPSALAGAIDGHSARFEGTAEHEDGRVLGFACDLDLEPAMAGAVTVRGRSVGPHELADRDDAMIVEIDARGWWRSVPFDDLWEARDADDRVVLEPGTPPYDSLLRAAQTSPGTITWAAP